MGGNRSRALVPSRCCDGRHGASHGVLGPWPWSVRLSPVPEVHLTLQWPDGLSSELYSPSTVILQHLPPGSQLSVAELETRGLAGLQQASERVRARYGFACTRTDEEALKLKSSLAAYAADQMVTVVSQP